MHDELMNCHISCVFHDFKAANLYIKSFSESGESSLTFLPYKSFQFVITHSLIIKYVEWFEAPYKET